MFFRDRQSVFLECFNIALYGFSRIFDRIVSGFSLGNTTWQARTFRNPITVFARMNNDLPH